jgi:deoxyadenosine/deoxycytidine kinase
MHIALAGNIGAGKTTLAGMLSKSMALEAEYDNVSHNPYIADFYQDMPRWALNLYVFNLTERLKQTVKIIDNRRVVTDYSIYEEAEIYIPNLLGMGLLSQRDFDTYSSLFSSIAFLVRPPDVLVYVKANISTLVDHIASRNLDYEESIRIEYLRKLNERYDAWFESYNRGKKIEFCVDDLDVVHNPSHISPLVQRLNAELFGLFPK